MQLTEWTRYVRRKDEKHVANQQSTHVYENLRTVAGLVPQALTSIQEVRAGLVACWPTRPSLRSLSADDYTLFKSGMRLVDKSRWDVGTLITVVEAAACTLDAHSVEPPTDIELPAWDHYGRVDPEAQLAPAPIDSKVLQSAIKTAEESKNAIERQLDEIERVAPPEAWLPMWGVDDARAFIHRGEPKWRRSRQGAPHEYRVRRREPSWAPQFVAFAQLIQSKGVLKTWGGDLHSYLEVDGHDYWTMGARVVETTVINRGEIGAPSAAQPLSSLSEAKLRGAVIRALEYRRESVGYESALRHGLGERLRQLLSPARQSK